eukprot:8237710-Pyramimonas_sp.AAC.1
MGCQYLQETLERPLKATYLKLGLPLIFEDTVKDLGVGTTAGRMRTMWEMNDTKNEALRIFQKFSIWAAINVKARRLFKPAVIAVRTWSHQ